MVQRFGLSHLRFLVFWSWHVRVVCRCVEFEMLCHVPIALFEIYFGTQICLIHPLTMLCNLLCRHFASFSLHQNISGPYVFQGVAGFL